MPRTPLKPTMASQLDEARDRLDVLIGTVEGGIRGPEHFDRCEEEGTAIAGLVRNAFRLGRA